MNSNFYGSGIVQSTVQEQENLQTINTNNIKTNIINTDSIKPNSDDEKELQQIKNKCKLNEFTQEEITILEDVIDSLYYKDTLKVGNVIVNHNKILDKLKLIVKENLIQLLEILNNIHNIQNAKNYLMICLYNNLGNTYIYNKKTISPPSRENERNYTENFFDSLYANTSYNTSAIAP